VGCYEHGSVPSDSVNVGNLTNCGTVNFSRRTVLHLVCLLAIAVSSLFCTFRIYCRCIKYVASHCKMNSHQD
jgi:hypothetical protein